MKKIISNFSILLAVAICTANANPVIPINNLSRTPLSCNADFIFVLQEKINLLENFRKNVSKDLVNKFKMQQATKQEEIEVINKLGYANFDEFKKKQISLNDLQNKLQKDYSDILSDKERFEAEVKYLINNNKIRLSIKNPCASMLWYLWSGCTMAYILNNDENASMLWMACMSIAGGIYLDCEFN